MITTAADEVLAQLRGAVDGLLCVEAAPHDLVGVLAEIEVQRRRLDAVDVRLVAGVDDGRVACDHGRTSTADLLVHELRVTPHEAKARVERARTLGPRRELTGAPLPPLLPATGGTPVTVLVRATPTDLAEFGGLARTEHGDVVSAASILGCGGEADVAVITLGAGGEVLNHDRTRRLATVPQRRALAVRDGGCCFPGCTRPVAWTEVHHVIRWIDGGPTDIDNLCLLCAHHHREIDRTDWQLAMTHGVPEWIPPPWIDHSADLSATPPTTSGRSASTSAHGRPASIPADRIGSLSHGGDVRVLFVRTRGRYGRHGRGRQRSRRRRLRA